MKSLFWKLSSCTLCGLMGLTIAFNPVHSTEQSKIDKVDGRHVLFGNLVISSVHGRKLAEYLKDTEKLKSKLKINITLNSKIKYAQGKQGNLYILPQSLKQAKEISFNGLFKFVNLFSMFFGNSGEKVCKFICEEVNKEKRPDERDITMDDGIRYFDLRFSGSHLGTVLRMYKNCTGTKTGQEDKEPFELIDKLGEVEDKDKLLEEIEKKIDKKIGEAKEDKRNNCKISYTVPLESGVKIKIIVQKGKLESVRDKNETPVNFVYLNNIQSSDSASTSESSEDEDDK